MKSRWQDEDAARAIEHYAKQGHSADVALRVYTSRLLGAEPALVLHGGGNTSVKTRQTDLAGDEIDVICVKGSGWDMAVIEPAGIPAVRQAPLLRLQGLDKLSDEDMVNARLVYENGCVAHVTASRIAARPKRRMRIWAP